MIFVSQHALQETLQNHHTRTTNGVEAFHHDLYRFVQRKKPIIETLRQIFNYLANEEANIKNVDKEYKIDYKSKPRYAQN